MIPDTASVLLFLAASVAVAASPGPSWAYVLSHAAARGPAAGALATAGNACGIAVHALAAAVGASAILWHSSTAFGVLKWAGAAYLIVLAIQTIRTGGALEARPEGSPRRSARRVFVGGVMVNVLNPKVALLMLALPPQFVDPAASHPAVQILVLGFVHVLVASTLLSGLTLSAGAVARAVDASPPLRRALRWASGGTLFAFGLGLLSTERG